MVIGFSIVNFPKNSWNGDTIDTFWLNKNTYCSNGLENAKHDKSDSKYVGIDTNTDHDCWLRAVGKK